MAKSERVRLRELREELRYWQQMARIDAHSLRGSRAKCFEIGAKMRAVQAESELVLLPEKHIIPFDITEVKQESLL